jgi:hypothetical protein
VRAVCALRSGNNARAVWFLNKGGNVWIGNTFVRRTRRSVCRKRASVNRYDPVQFKGPGTPYARSPKVCFAPSATGSSVLDLATPADGHPTSRSTWLNIAIVQARAGQHFAGPDYTRHHAAGARRKPGRHQAHHTRQARDVSHRLEL